MTTTTPTSYRSALFGLLAILVGLATLVVLPIMARYRSDNKYEQISQIEKARGQINQALDLAFQVQIQGSDAYFTHSFTNSSSKEREKFQGLVSNWKKVTASEQDIRACDEDVLKLWETGTRQLGEWLDFYAESPAKFEDVGPDGPVRKKDFQFGVQALVDAVDKAGKKQIELRDEIQAIHRAELYIALPMLLICFLVAGIAGANLRSLRRAWAQEQETAARLEVAVKEGNHRIKNNLQVIGALIDMQLQEPGTSVPKRALEDVVQQVKTVAAVHDFLSQELRSDRVQADKMLQKLVDLTAQPAGVEATLDTQLLALPVKQATALALITNELLLNAGKHGATQVCVRMKTEGETSCLEVCDNGPGFSPDFDVAEHANIGLALVDTLARHDLAGEAVFFTNSGAHVTITFPLSTA